MVIICVHCSSILVHVRYCGYILVHCNNIAVNDSFIPFLNCFIPVHGYSSLSPIVDNFCPHRWGPRSRFCARSTLRSAPHRHQRKFSPNPLEFISNFLIFFNPNFCCPKNIFDPELEIRIENQPNWNFGYAWQKCHY